MSKWLSLFTFLLVSPLAKAGLYASVDGLYLSDSFTTATSASYSRTNYGFDLMVNVDQNHYWYTGFHANQFAAQDSQSSTTTQLSSLDMGPFVKWVVDRRRVMVVGAGFNVISKGTYSTGSANSELTGTSLLGSLEIAPEVSENWHIGVKFSYYSIGYTKSTSTSSASDISYSRNLIFPSLVISFRK